MLSGARLLPLSALIGLLAPIAVAVGIAIGIAGWLEPSVEAMLAPAIAWSARRPPTLDTLLAGPYGFLTMAPLLLVWAVPAAVALAVVQALGTTSGLLDALARGAEPLVRPLGMDGAGLVQLVAGFGCNVPAVLASRRCGACVRRPTVAAIGFGSICSYQLAATIAVLGAAGTPRLLVPYLVVVLIGTVTHTWWVHRSLVGPTASETANETAAIAARGWRTIGARTATAPTAPTAATVALRPPATASSLRAPQLGAVLRQSRQTLQHLLQAALPVFLVVTMMAAVAELLGVDAVVAQALGPLMLALGLPTAVAVAVVLASVRKDGLLLLAAPAVLATLDPGQLLAALVLAGTLTPCLVTVTAMTRVIGLRGILPVLARQAALALALTASIAWSSRLLG